MENFIRVNPIFLRKHMNALNNNHRISKDNKKEIISTLVEDTLGVPLNQYQQKLIDNMVDIMESLNVTKELCCKECYDKQLNLCEGIAARNGQIDGCPHALAMYTQKYNELHE